MSGHPRLNHCWFLRLGKTGVPGEKPLGARHRANNKLNPHMVSLPGFEPGHIGGRQVLPPLRHPCSLALDLALKFQAMEALSSQQ